jgi:hypothetical protein
MPDARRMPRRGILRITCITWTTIMTLDQPRIFIAIAERRRVAHHGEGTEVTPVTSSLPRQANISASASKTCQGQK